MKHSTRVGLWCAWTILLILGIISLLARCGHAQTSFSLLGGGSFSHSLDGRGASPRITAEFEFRRSPVEFNNRTSVLFGPRFAALTKKITTNASVLRFNKGHFFGGGGILAGIVRTNTGQQERESFSPIFEGGYHGATDPWAYEIYATGRVKEFGKETHDTSGVEGVVDLRRRINDRWGLAFKFTTTFLRFHNQSETVMRTGSAADFQIGLYRTWNK